MSRPAVSVVMPFAGSQEAAREAVGALRALRVGPGDELILADNLGVVEPAAGVEVLHATGERSPAHARNAGAARGRAEWILFLDADCRPVGDLLERYFAPPPGSAVGAVAGEIRAAAGGTTLAARYGRARNFLSQRAHLAHPYLPRAAAANLLVRREAFHALGGFLEGLRAAEDTDFCWRLQQAGWTLELREAACVEHVYRESLGDLRRQWRAYAAGRAWLARRYEGFAPEPAVVRGLGRLIARARPARRDHSMPQDGRKGSHSGGRGRLELRFVDVVLALEELWGFLGSNRPASPAPAPGQPVLVGLAAPEDERVEAPARGITPSPSGTYWEDDGAADRLRALVAIALRHPRRCLDDLRYRGEGDPPLRVLAPAAYRLERDHASEVRAAPGAARVARRLAALSGRPLSPEGR